MVIDCRPSFQVRMDNIFVFILLIFMFPVIFVLSIITRPELIEKWKKGMSAAYRNLCKDPNYFMELVWPFARV